jgi:flagellar assembly factor FliW
VTLSEARQAQARAITDLVAAGEREFHFPEGLLGFASCRSFMLGRYRPPDGSPSPFFILRAPGEGVSFPLILPHLFAPDYEPPIGPETLAKLGASSATDLAVLVIVTLRERLEDITVNLQGPVILNPSSRTGLQLVTEGFPLRYPLLKNLPM